jgi:hypothetical protein
MHLERLAFLFLAGWSAACGGGDSGGQTIPPNLQTLVTSPQHVSFGYASTGASAPSTLVSVTNTGRPVGPLRVSLRGALPSEDLSAFQVEDDTCTGKSIDVGASCSLKVHFVPASAGTKSAELDVNGPPGSVALGYVLLFGQATALAVEPMQFDFGTVPVGTVSAPATFTVTASSGATGSIRPLSLGSPQPRGFVISGDGCSGRSLAPGAQCTFALSFAPTTVGSSSDGMLISSTDDSMMNCTVQGAAR